MKAFFGNSKTDFLSEYFSYFLEQNIYQFLIYVAQKLF